MRKIHIAISTNNLQGSIKEYSERLGCHPCSIVEEDYALWRTETVNLSIRKDPKCKPGELRHLGWEDPEAKEFTQETDINGILWENFNAKHQAEEINSFWPQANYTP